MQDANTPKHGQKWSIVPLSGSSSDFLPNTLLLSFVREAPGPHICNLILRSSLLRRGFIVSTGSACNKSGPSPVLAAIGAPYIVRRGVLRISLGDLTTRSECDRLVSAILLSIAEQDTPTPV
jgi:cysteine sulfinate desulfinase/cysteine desulfurase-like protein